MTLALYFQCFLVATVGALLQAAIYLKNTQAKAKLANVEFKAGNYLKDDWLSIVISMLTIIMFLMVATELLSLQPAAVDYVRISFAFIGYFSQDIASRLFGAMNKKVNAVIDKKTTIADQVTGETGPTPTKQ